MKISTERSRKFKIKEPGSAITHFIGCVMALLAALPLLIKAAREPDRIHMIAMSIFILSMILLYAASTIYHTVDSTENGPHDDFYFDCRKLHAGVPDCSAGKNRDYALCSSVDGCIHRNCC